MKTLAEYYAKHTVFTVRDFIGEFGSLDAALLAYLRGDLDPDLEESFERAAGNVCVMRLFKLHAQEIRAIRDETLNAIDGWKRVGE